MVSSKVYMGVSKNRGILPPKWMVKIMENPIKMDDLGGKTTPIFWVDTYIYFDGIIHPPVHPCIRRMPRP